MIREHEEAVEQILNCLTAAYFEEHLELQIGKFVGAQPLLQSQDDLLAIDWISPTTAVQDRLWDPILKPRGGSDAFHESS